MARWDLVKTTLLTGVLPSQAAIIEPGSDLEGSESVGDSSMVLGRTSPKINHSAGCSCSKLNSSAWGTLAWLFTGADQGCHAHSCSMGPGQSKVLTANPKD